MVEREVREANCETMRENRERREMRKEREERRVWFWRVWTVWCGGNSFVNPILVK